MEVANHFEKELIFDVTYVWINREQQYLTEIVTQWGLCFTYNIAYSSNLLNINATSDDFHYVYAPRWLQDDNLNDRLREFPDRTSTSKAGFRAKFNPNFNNLVDMIGHQYTIILHDPYELPTENSKVMKFNIYYQTNVLVVPQLNSIDESLVEDKPDE